MRSLVRVEIIFLFFLFLLLFFFGLICVEVYKLIIPLKTGVFKHLLSPAARSRPNPRTQDNESDEIDL